MSRSQISPFIADWPASAQAEQRRTHPAFAPDPYALPPDAHCLRPADAVSISPVEPRNPSGPRRWAVTMASGPRRLVEARGFRIESGAVVFVEPVGCVAAFAPGTWSTVEEDRTNA